MVTYFNDGVKLFSLAFFSFIELSDSSKHRQYNEWHQLDHLPENLALKQVAWGQRWARQGGLRNIGAAVDPYTDVDYAAMYWFRGDPNTAVAEWEELGEETFQKGRGPFIPGVKRRLLAFFRPVEGQVASRIGVGPEVLPYRPNQGVYITLSRYQEPHGLATHDRFRWESQELLPALVSLEGVAGAWTMTFERFQVHRSLPFDSGDEIPFGGMRMRLIYLDGDPEQAAKAIEQQVADLNDRCDEVVKNSEQVLISGPLRSIIPWEDW